MDHLIQAWLWLRWQVRDSIWCLVQALQPSHSLIKLWRLTRLAWGSFSFIASDSVPRHTRQDVGPTHLWPRSSPTDSIICLFLCAFIWLCWAHGYSIVSVMGQPQYIFLVKYPFQHVCDCWENHWCTLKAKWEGGIDVGQDMSNKCLSSQSTGMSLYASWTSFWPN